MNLKEYRAIFPGLYGDVVTEDIYRLRSLDFQPDVIFDIGANIGYFTHLARGLFPNALIVAVEPHPENIRIFQENCPEPGLVATEADVKLFCGAIGSHGQVWRAQGAANGASEVYITEGLGYPPESFDDSSHFLPANAPSRSLATIAGGLFDVTGARYIVKIDCEGGENAIFSDPASMDILIGAEYIAAELHYHCDNGGEMHEVIHATTSALLEISRTHGCESKGPMFYARKRR